MQPPRDRVQHEITHWAQLMASSSRARPLLDSAPQWLRVHAPPVSRAALVHGDFKANNLAADGLALPNGAVITPDGRHFVVAESFAGKLTHFERAANGDLSNARCYAELPKRIPDGICLDVDGNIWGAEFGGGQFSLIDTQGEAIAVVDVRPHAAVACQLGGADGRTLYCLVYPGLIPDIAAGKPGGRIDVARVTARAAGSP